MMNYVRQLADGQIGSGSVNAVQRIGNTVQRPFGEWSTSVHGLLNHLESSGFEYSPRVLKIDEKRGIEVLSYIEGEVALRPWPPWLLSTEGLASIGHMVRAYHDVVRDYQPTMYAKWRNPKAQWQPGMIIRHADLGPWNMVWRSGKLVGLIDWDLAEPGYPIEDIAQVAWSCVPITRPAKCIEAGVQLSTLRERLAVLSETCGVQVVDVIEAVFRLQDKEMATTRELGHSGIEPWKAFLVRGDIADIQATKEWLKGNYVKFIG